MGRGGRVWDPNAVTCSFRSAMASSILLSAAKISRMVVPLLDLVMLGGIGFLTLDMFTPFATFGGAGFLTLDMFISFLALDS